MQLDFDKYNQTNYKCPKCLWQGKGAELEVEDISEEFSIIDLACPNCGEHIGFIQPYRLN